MNFKNMIIITKKMEDLYLLYAMGENDFDDAYLRCICTETALVNIMCKYALEELKYDDMDESYPETFYMVIKTKKNEHIHFEPTYYKLVYDVKKKNYDVSIDNTTFKKNTNILTIFN